MGTDGSIVKIEEDFSIDKMLLDILKASYSANLICMTSGVMYNTYTNVNIGNINMENNFLMYLYLDNNSIFKNHDFSWISKSENLGLIFFIENLNGVEKIVLDFIYEYLKLNLHDYFWSDNEWYYTFNDIKQIKESPYDPNWCYKPPKRYT